MKNKRHSLLTLYKASLNRFLHQGRAANLQPALRLGCQAVALQLETLDLAHIHEQALIEQVISIRTATSRNQIIKRAKTFFAEAIIPIEQTHRFAKEANIHLSRLNRGLNQRTLDLAASNNQLKKEITRRQVVEKNLRESEQHSGRLLEQSQRLQEQLRLLSRGILSIQEDERKRISRELHDVIAQMLTGINVQLSALKSEASLNSNDLSRSISKTQKMVEKSVDVIHRFACELRPAVLDDLGLIPALHTFLKSFTKKSGIRVSLTAFAAVEELSNAQRTALYRVAHEALTNVTRHARASRVEISIRKLANTVCMDISDNGKGFDANRVLFVDKSKRLGLLGIRERVEMLHGLFTVTSTPGKGTTIHTKIPFKEYRRP